MKVITVDALRELIKQTTFESFNALVIQALEEDFKRWSSFNKTPRNATHYPFGVIELMPCSDDNYYTFKYVNGHPRNTAANKLNVVALGVLADVATGYPLLFCEMTLLTAIRTAATAALAAKYLARANSQSLALIGTGAQAEFVLMAMKSVFNINAVSYYDIDKSAMDKFQQNMKNEVPQLRASQSIADALSDADIIVTATAAKKSAKLIDSQLLKPGVHIHAMGGDCPGKTEFDPKVLQQCKVVVEFLEQSLKEGEIQNCSPNIVYAELWELLTDVKDGRVTDEEITFFDSVGFALEDFSILKTVYQLAEQTGVGTTQNMIPSLVNPKDLYSLIRQP